MTLQEVKDLAIKGEGLQIEFKKKAAYPEKIAGVRRPPEAASR